MNSYSRHSTATSWWNTKVFSKEHKFESSRTLASD